MQFTGTSSVDLPKVREFYFSITGIKVSNTGVVQFSFSDTGNNSFPFVFSGGFIQTDRAISTYNLIDESTIEGYITSGSPSGVLSYKVNDVFYQKPVLFSGLDKLTVSGNSNTVQCNIAILSNPINYSVSIAPSYQCYSGISGQITSDVAFTTNPMAFTFYNSNKELLTGYNTGIRLATGTTQLFLKDVDDSFMDYSNEFELSIPTTFGDIGKKFESYRTGVSNLAILSLSDSQDNEYHQYSLFDGTWQDRAFIYENNVLTYNLGFKYGNKNSLGDGLPAKIWASFNPIVTTTYESKYITGFSLVSGGEYTSAPSFSGAQYYYVTGVQNALESFLFSSGCNSVGVSYSGGSPLSSGSGIFVLKSVKISGIYGNGVNTFKIVSGYSGISNGSGYQSAPRFVLSTGGGCYSLPDASGVELAQFKRASGYGAVYAQAAGLTGIAVMTGMGVSGVKVSNIGMGYGATLPPTVRFVRQDGDIGTQNASGLFSYKTTSSYSADQLKSYISFDKNFVPLDLTKYNVSGDGTMKIKLVISGLDSTAPGSGRLNVYLSGNGDILTGEWIIYQSRTFDLSPYAMANPEPPSNLTVPLPDLSFGFDQSQYEEQYISDIGSKVNNIVEF